MNRIHSERSLMMPLSGQKNIPMHLQLAVLEFWYNLKPLQHKLKAINTYHIHEKGVAFELKPGWNKMSKRQKEPFPTGIKSTETKSRPSSHCQPSFNK